MKKLPYFFIVLCFCVLCVPLFSHATVLAESTEVELTQDNFVNTMTVGQSTYSKFILTEDIVLQNTWESLNISDKTFDGNGHKITLSNPLFKSVTNCVIKNLGVEAADNFVFDRSNITNKIVEFGLLASSVSNSTINCCYCIGAVSVKIASGACIGGLVGVCDSSIIKDCYSKAKLSVMQFKEESKTTIVGGLVGKVLYSSRVTNSYSLTDKGNIILIEFSETLTVAKTNIIAGGICGLAENGEKGILTNLFTIGDIEIGKVFDNTEVIVGHLFGKITNYNETQCLCCYFYSSTEEDEYNLIGQADLSFNATNNKILKLNSNIFTNINSFRGDYMHENKLVWNEGFNWDTDVVWCKMANYSVIVLQVFEYFPVTIATERNYTGIEIQIQEFNYERDRYENTDKTSFKYGTQLRLSISINDEMEPYKNIKNLKSVIDYSENLEIDTGKKESTYDFVLTNKTARQYYATTENVKYILNVESEDQSTGNVKASSSSTEYAFITQDIEYQGEYSYTATPTSASYAFDKWVWVTSEGEEIPALFGNRDPTNFSTQYITIKFGDTEQIDNKFTYLKTYIDNSVLKTNTAMEIVDDAYVFTLRAKFTRDTRKLEIKTNSTLASCNIIVDGVTYDKITDYTSLFENSITRARPIEITAVMHAGYIFTNWETGDGRALSGFIDTMKGESETSLTIHVTIMDDFVLYLNFEKEEDQKTDLTFLWYIGGAVVGAGVITLIIFLIKRGGGGKGGKSSVSYY